MKKLKKNMKKKKIMNKNEKIWKNMKKKEKKKKERKNVNKNEKI